MTAVLTLAVLLVGLPLLAFWLGGRPFWGRLRLRQDRDLYGDVVRRHRLTPTQTARVESAVAWGRELADPVERAAAVDWAQGLIADTRQRAREHPLRRRLLLALLGAWVLLVLGRAVVAVVESGLAGFNWYGVVTGTVVVALVVQSGRAPRRAVLLNAGPPSIEVRGRRAQPGT
ncbi:hypothetical protein GB931_17155 [Modestobacter sp. I12A-02628]|uniref:Uncharacterized protein n=1 Tax=Goekera deserti TaxID=2497753 RepID=A0A7K3WDX8_9ACTN|nr:hypothetical protein [Goekera deserti]MPQ99613.1 hypothetical protein [Goekera deserti]NDI46377.1 hypothetical protein [Goekera deserti]NEL54691.1 hypothetical protein [Goekera deserti]